ncbi:MAG: LLM class flavin-dependent oxidoreductase [Alphaproteobacteria bacterium]|nr:LLM class flavin-dependent oxidoreductase [Alphaproteobacteria bacterium]MBV9152506.1 LLM class flavin-dependent oxidoreductase [Alphaproteobacteria bacterium]
MRIGISLTTNYPEVTNPRQGACWIVERAAAARRAGLDSLFIGDQHASPTPYYQNTPMLGRLLAEWGEAPAGCLFLLPLWHPVLVAEQIGTLAAIAQGPFIMQCGLGWGEDRFAAMGASIRTRPSAFEEALHIVRRLLAGETVSSSRRFRVTQATLTLRPAEPVAVHIGASAPPAIDRAARLAEGWIASPGLPFDEARTQADLYRERCAACGREPGAIVLRRDIYVGESSTEAQSVLQQALSRGYRGIPAEALIAGSVDEVAEQFRSFEELGYTEILVRHLTNDQAKVLGSLERLTAVRAALA